MGTSVNATHLVRQIAVPFHHHRLELREVVHGQDARDDELVELRLRGVRHDVDELLGDDAEIGEEPGQQLFDEVFELLVDVRVRQFVLFLAVEHEAVRVDEAHERGRVHRALLDGAVGVGEGAITSVSERD
eukprot:31417-Pelagococcus_subviridis.AAC.5